MNSVDSMQGDSSDQSMPHFQSRPQAPGPLGSKFSIMYFNCRSMLPKFDELVALCLNEKMILYVLLRHGFVKIFWTQR